ncbi:hypothetical protein [Rhizobium leguminosarum]|uniref:hypothetical protein n=1 Tax=Rhizobium leguminosarum TaxID=384 RepID=UPI002E0EA990|nr:hypothetical protein U8Q02_36210 [Rhizobium leguminosarum]
MNRKKAAYQRQALREMENWKTLEYSPEVRRKIWEAASALDERQDELHSYEDGMVLIKSDIKDELEQATVIHIDGRRVSVDPFSHDIIDDLRILVSLDPDHASDQNGEGLGKNTSFKARRVLAQFDQGHLNSDDLIDGSSAAATHFIQMNEFYASMTGMTAGEVAAIREARLQVGELTSSDRINDVLDEDYRFSKCTYLYSDETGLAIHVADEDPTPLAVYRNSCMLESAFRQFYDFGQPKFDPDRKRTVNGEQIGFASLLFPREPYVAADLIAVVRSHYPGALIADDVLQLASSYVSDPDFQIAAHVDDEPDDDTGFTP